MDTDKSPKNTLGHNTQKTCCVQASDHSSNSQITPNKAMEAQTNFAQAIECIVRERDRVFVERIAKEYNLPVEELKAKYIESATAAIKVPRQYKKREPTAVNVVGVAETAKVPKAKAEKQCCTAQTSKKEPCKFSALKGEVFCKRHLKQSLGEGAESKEPKVKVPKVPKAKKPDAPEHTHALDAEIHSECALCESHGNPLTEIEPAFEVVPKMTADQMSTRDRLAALLADSADSDSDEPTSDALSEEEFEDDD